MSVTHNTISNREIDKRIFNIMTPIIFENVLMTLSSIILTSFIGRLAVDDISIYGMTSRVSSIFYALFRGMGVGVMILAAKAYGEGKKDRCRWLTHQGYVSIFPVALLLTLLIIIFPRPVLSIMTSDPNLLDHGERILRLVGTFMSCQALIGLNAAAFQAFGDTKTPMLIAGFGNVLAIIVGYVLILGVNGIGGYGLIGAAWSQVISWVGMTILGFFLIYGKGGLYYDVPTDHKLFDLPNGKDVKDIYTTGVPVALEYSSWSVATVYISRVILMYGSAYYAAYQLGLQAEMLCDVVSAGFLTGSMTLSAMAIGAMDDDLYRRYHKRLNFFCFIVCMMTMTFLATMTRPVLHFLTDKEELVEIAMTYLIAMVFSQIPQHMCKVLSGYIRTSGHPQVPTIISIVGIVTRVLLVILFGQVLHLSIVWVWWAFNIDLWIRYISSMIYFRRHRIIDHVSDHLEQAHQ